MYFAWNRPRGQRFPGGEAFVQRQRLWDQTGGLSNGGVLADRNTKESGDEPEILHPNRPGAS